MMFFILTPILFTLFTAFFIWACPWWNLKDKISQVKFFYFIPVTIVISGLASAGIYGIGVSKQYSKEVWHTKIYEICHEEEWTTREITTYTTTDSKGNTTTHTRTYTEHHGPYWTITDENGTEYSVDESEYNTWKKIWGNEQLTGVHHGSSAGGDIAISGNIYKCKWNREFNTLYPYSTIHRYKNKLRCGTSILEYAKPTPELMKKWPRPADINNSSPIFGYGYNVKDFDLLYLSRVNAMLGEPNQIHTICLVFGPEHSRSVMDEILSAWQGPNKNELITFVGLNKEGKVEWCEAVSWMDNTSYHAMIGSHFLGKTFEPQEYGKLLMDTVHKNWKRKEFKEFDYVQVEISWYFFVICVFLVIVLQVVCALGINAYVESEFRKKHNYSNYYNSRFHNWR